MDHALIGIKGFKFNSPQIIKSCTPTGFLIDIISNIPHPII